MPTRSENEAHDVLVHARHCRGPIHEEAALSRLYGGIHFRSDNEAGLVLGRKVAKAAISHYVRSTVR